MEQISITINHLWWLLQADSKYAIVGVLCSRRLPIAIRFVVAESFVLRMNISGKNPAHRNSATKIGNHSR